MLYNYGQTGETTSPQKSPVESEKEVQGYWLGSHGRQLKFWRDTSAAGGIPSEKCGI